MKEEARRNGEGRKGWNDYEGRTEESGGCKEEEVEVNGKCKTRVRSKGRKKGGMARMENELLSRK